MKYYILDSRQIVGNCVMWWRANGAGYTCDLNDAGLYETKPGDRDTDVMVPEDVARSLAITHVRIERLREALDQRGITVPYPTSGAHARSRRGR